MNNLDRINYTIMFIALIVWLIITYDKVKDVERKIDTIIISEKE